MHALCKIILSTLHQSLQVYKPFILQGEEPGKPIGPTALVLGTNDNFAAQGTGKKIVAAMPNRTFYPVQVSDIYPGWKILELAENWCWIFKTIHDY